jgi:hypothetical protein
MLSLLALVLWMIAIPCFLAGLVWIGLGAGVLAFVVSRAAFDRPDDMETLFGLGLQAMLVIGVIQLLSAAFP